MRGLGSLAVLVLVTACSACTTGTTRGGSPSTTGAPTTSVKTSTTARARGASGGLTISLSATPAHGTASTPVTFTLKATASHAPGALHYQVTYGDGASAANATPLFCRAGPGQAASQTWSLTHRYAAPGSYTVTATVGVNCSPDRATATLTVRP